MHESSTVFFQGEYCRSDAARVGIRTKALNYCLGCFEGIRGYWNETENQLYLFRLEEHYKRLTCSCKILHLNLSYTVDEMVKITEEVCRRNDHREDVYVRPIAYNDSEDLSPIFSDDPCAFAVYTLPLRDYIEASNGISAGVSSWRRVSDNMIPARAKPTAAYLNSALARIEARENGFDEAILLTNDGFVAEGSAEHIFLVRDGALITPATQDDNLEGITQKTLLELVTSKLGLRVEQRRVSRTELYVADEAFLCGTGCEIAPLVTIDRRPVGDGKVGPVTTRIKALYLEVARGTIAEYRDWCHPVNP